MTRQHEHQESFAATPEELFALLHTPSAIREWWSAARAIVIAEPGGTWMAAWGEEEDQPDYITAATLSVFEPPQRLVLSNYRYFSKDGPLPFEADFTTEFVVEPDIEGASLRVIQSGFPSSSEADQFLEACEQGWSDTFAGIHRFIESKADGG